MKRGILAAAVSAVLAAALLAPRPAHALSDVIYTSGGEGLDDQYGFAVAVAGDVNRDGTADYAVGAPFFDATLGESQALVNAGKAYVHSGVSGEIIRTFEGEAAAMRLGSSIAAVGDLDGDGAADLAVGAPYFADGGQVQVGKVNVYSGAGGQLLYALVGENQGDQFGFAIAGIGDQNADAVPDLLVGAPEFDGPGGLGSGRVYLYSGADGAPLHAFDGESPSDRFGAAVANAGNLDGDGVDDIAVGAPDRAGSAGAAYAYRGSNRALLVGLDGAEAGNRFGASMAGGGDTDGDGRDDLIVGSPGRDILCPGTGAGDPPLNFPDVGRIDWYSGAELASGFPGVAPVRTKDGDYFVPCKIRGGYQAQFGATIQIVADYDLDGKADVLVGSPGADGANGKVFLYSGANGATILEFFGGEAASLGYGSAVAEIRDVTGDGIPDVLIGAYQHESTNKNDSGRVYVHSGAQANLISNTRRFKPDEFAAAVAGVDDLDGDGLADYCGGAPLWEVDFLEDPGGNFGTVECYSGASNDFSGLVSELVSTAIAPDPALPDGCLPPLPAAEGQQFGRTLAALPSGPGGPLADLIVGTPDRTPVNELCVRLGDAGVVYRVAAETGEVLQTYEGVEIGDHFGASVANAGDVDGDGVDDLIIGAPNARTVAGTNTGRAYVFSGAYDNPGDPPVLLHLYEGENAGDLFGTAVSGAGDVDGDGKDDLVVGAPGVDEPASNAGRIYVFSGASPSTVPIFRLEGSKGGEGYGSSLARLADLNGNGFDDFAVGSPNFDAPQRTNTGRAVIVDGGTQTEILALEGEAKSDAFGTAVSRAEDVDGDGLPELMVGAPVVLNLVGWATGKVYVYSTDPEDDGTLSATLLLTYTGQANGDRFGASLAPGGDMDGDDVPDVVVGAHVHVGTAGASTALYGKAYAFNVVCKDRDGDGYGNPPTPLCPEPALDCKDTDPDVHPGQPEVVGNGKDDDCDVLTPEICEFDTLIPVILAGPNPPPAEQSMGSIVSCLRAFAQLGV